jgi:hypothetical protein
MIFRDAAAMHPEDVGISAGGLNISGGGSNTSAMSQAMTPQNGYGNGFMASQIPSVPTPAQLGSNGSSADY